VARRYIPRCTAWRHRKQSIHNGGGRRQFFTGTARDFSSPSLPTICNGMDVRALAQVTMSCTMRMFEAMRMGRPAPGLDYDELNSVLARLPDKPDEFPR
jgi:hypothetical protein